MAKEHENGKTALHAIFVIEDKPKEFVRDLEATLAAKREENPSFNYLVVGGEKRKTKKEHVQKALDKGNYVLTDQTTSVVSVHGNYKTRHGKGDYEDYTRQDILDTLDKNVVRQEGANDKMQNLLFSCKSGMAQPGENSEVLNCGSQKYNVEQGPSGDTMLAIASHVGDNNAIFNDLVDHMLKTSETYFYKDGENKPTKIAGIKKPEGGEYDFSLENISKHIKDNTQALGNAVKADEEVIQNRQDSVSGQDVNTYRDSQLHRSLYRESFDKANAAIEQGANIENADTRNIMFRAIRKGMGETVDALVDMEIDFSDEKKNKQTPLQAAFEYADRDIINKLLDDKSADLKQLGNNGNTLMHYAAELGYVEVMQKIHEKDPSIIEMTNKNGTTPMHKAAENGKIEAMEWLNENNGALVSQASNNGSLPLHNASHASSDNAIKWLLENNTDPSQVLAANSDGVTPLHVAARSGKKQNFVTLLENGADIGAKAIDGTTAMDHVMMWNKKEFGEQVAIHEERTEAAKTIQKAGRSFVEKLREERGGNSPDLQI